MLQMRKSAFMRAKAQQFERSRIQHIPPYNFRDAQELVLWGLFKGGGDRICMGTRAKIWYFPKEYLEVTVYSPDDGNAAEVDQEAYTIGLVFLSNGARFGNSYLTVWQKGKLLDDVRSGALRSVFRDSY
jgi:hypothetical protein